MESHLIQQHAGLEHRYGLSAITEPEIRFKTVFPRKDNRLKDEIGAKEYV